jgi:CubicO group peptidase (beta-lactamase class C family)
MRTLQILVWGVSMIALVLFNACASVHRGGTKELEAAIAAASESSQLEEGSLVDPEEEPDPQAPLTALQDLTDEIEALAARRYGAGHLPSKSRDHLAAAARRVSEAGDAYGASEPSLPRMFEAIAAALGELDRIESEGQELRSKLEDLSKRLASVARRVAADATAVAVAAKSSAAYRAQEQVAQGDAFLADGVYVVAVNIFADGFSIASGGLVLDLDLLEENIRGALDGETVGYAYAIGRDGVLYADSEGVGGLARTSADSPETSQSPAKEMYTASITKTISATALLKALHDAGIGVDEAIGPYLPPDWEQGENLELVTFRHLLTHTSGLDPNDNSAGGKTPQTDASLETIIAQGSDDDQRGDHFYRNANFSLVRVLLPRIVYGAQVDALAIFWGREAVHAGLYEHYVSHNVLAPSGISQDQCQPTESSDTQTLLYPFPPGDEHGLTTDDWTFSCGATGWFLSALDLASFMAHLRFTDDILEPETRALMDSDFLGWLDPIAYSTWVQGTWGTYRAHKGDYDNMVGCIMNFPSAANPEFPGVKVQVSVLLNSTGGSLGGDLPVTGPRQLCKVLKVAYDEAWVAN